MTRILSTLRAVDLCDLDRQSVVSHFLTSRSAPGVKPVVRKPDAGKPGEKAGTASGTNFTLFTSTFLP